MFFSLSSIKNIALLSTALSCFILSPAFAGGGISITGTRFIYPENASQLNVEVSNSSDQDNYLIQSWVGNGGGGKSADFVVTPPLYLSKPQSKNILRLIRTGGSFPTDRETLFYLVVKAIPSIDEAHDAGRNVIHVTAASQLKLFLRPRGLVPAPDKAPSLVTFSRSGGRLTVHNPSPYYLTLTQIRSGNQALQDVMVAPKSELALPPASGGSVTFQTINDYGGLTAARRVRIQ